MLDTLRTNQDRLLADLSSLAQIGGTPDGGVNRPALSDTDLEARRWFREQAEEAGLAVRQDGAGNISAVLESSSPDARTIILGSHLDSVPNGGRFDGALGVVAALEVLRTLKEVALNLPHHLEAINFTDEEGTWRGLLGSRGLAGKLTEDDLTFPREGQQSAFEARLAAAGLTWTGLLNAGRDPATIKAWVEVHIEQGTRLEESGLAIGPVTGIVGIENHWLTFTGRADHAGTTPLNRRRDALQGAAAFIGRARDLIRRDFPGGVVTCGIVKALPGAFNIVPERADLSVEFRHSDGQTLTGMRQALQALAREIAEEEALAVKFERHAMHPPAPMHPAVIEAIEQAANSMGLGSKRLASYAGHDSQVMAHITQAGMFFVPSVGGLSHSPREFTRDEDCVNAGNVLLHTALILAETN